MKLPSLTVFVAANAGVASTQGGSGQTAVSSSDGNMQVVPVGTETSQPNTQPVTPPNWGA